MGGGWSRLQALDIGREGKAALSDAGQRIKGPRGAHGLDVTPQWTLSVTFRPSIAFSSFGEAQISFEVARLGMHALQLL